MILVCTARLRAHPLNVARMLHVAAFSALAASAAMAQGTTISGHVTTAGSGEAVAGASVIAIGTTSTAITSQDGRYTLKHIGAGPVDVQVLRVGFQSQKKNVVVSGVQPQTADFALVPMIVKLDEVVTVATGQERTVEHGYGTALMADVADRMERSPTTLTVGDLITQKAPSVSVLGQGMLGTAASVRIRGFDSFNQSNEPIFIVDGIRVATNTTVPGQGVGGSQTGLLNSLPPDEIESVEILKGPAAAVMYGTNAANGVIRITTKKGRVGNARWTWMTEQGTMADKNTYPATYAIWGHAPGLTAPIRCLLPTMGAATCLQDSVTSLNLLSNSGSSPGELVGATSPLATNPRNLYGLQVVGGTDPIRFYISGNVENAYGPLSMPGVSVNRLDSIKVATRGEWLHPEALQRENLRFNVDASLTPTLDLGINAAFIKSDQRLPQSDNSPVGIYAAARESPGFAHAGLGYTNIGALGETLNGYNQWVPSEMFQDLSTENVQRQLLSGTGSWRPQTWLQNDAVVGVDFASVTDFNACRLNECAAFGTLRNGDAFSRTAGYRTLSAHWASSGAWAYRPDINLKTTAGWDYVYAENDAAYGLGLVLPPGAQNVSQAANRANAANLQATVGKTSGLFLQEQAALRDRLFLSLGLRGDQNSAFGNRSGFAAYPSASASWVMSDESFFPKFAWLDQFRPRVAYGVSGLQPGLATARETFAPITSNINNSGDVQGLIANQVAGPNLKPERVSEVEGGFDTRILKNRVNIELTYFHKSTTDAILSVPIAASSAAPSLALWENIGSLSNSGVEASVTTQIVNRRDFAWDVTIGASHGSSQVTNLGPSGTLNYGNTRQAVGYPVYGLFFHPYTFSDANNDGRIQPSEVVVDTSTKFFGYQTPRDLVSFQNGFDLLSHRLRISALLDYKGGYSVFDASSAFLCTQYLSCPDESNPSATLADQARAVAARYGTTVNGTVYTTNAGYLSNGAFWRLREVSAALMMPDRINKALRAQGVTLDLGARNLHIWTKYRGVDPESNYGAGDLQTDFLTAGPPTYYTARFTFHY